MSDIVEKARGVLGDELTLGGVVVECTDVDGLYDVDREDGSSVASDLTLEEATRIAEAFRERADLAEEVIRTRTWRKGPPPVPEPGTSYRCLVDMGSQTPFVRLAVVRNFDAPTIYFPESDGPRRLSLLVETFPEVRHYPVPDLVGVAP